MQNRSSTPEIELDFDADAFARELRAYRNAHPDCEGVEAFVVPIAGSVKGKWQPMDALEGLAQGAKGAMRMPHSAATIQIWGEDIAGLPLVYEQGDPDALCLPVRSRLCPIPWAQRPTAQLLVTPYDPKSGMRSPYAPRNILMNLAERVAAIGLTPVVACELEFCLIDAERLAETGRPFPPRTIQSGQLAQSQAYDLAVSARLAPLFDAIRDACAAQQLPLKALSCEVAPGQVEINLTHVADPLRAADQAVLLKRLVAGVAQQQGYAASFMAKPYADAPGNGFHLHLSLLNAAGENVFSAQSDAPNAVLSHALAGLLNSLPDFQAVFAPHANSYRRYGAGLLVPLHLAWGYEHRSVALRVIDPDGPAARIEHRVAGADANPYLVVAAVLAGLLKGLAEQSDPGPTIQLSYELARLPRINRLWATAIKTFEESSLAREAFGAAFHEVFVAGRREEYERFEQHLTDFEFQHYLTRV